MASEAKVVAARILFGKEMNARRNVRQDRAWEETYDECFRPGANGNGSGTQWRNVSVFTWANPRIDSDHVMPGFDVNGRMQLGGLTSSSSSRTVAMR